MSRGTAQIVGWVSWINLHRGAEVGQSLSKVAFAEVGIATSAAGLCVSGIEPDRFRIVLDGQVVFAFPRMELAAPGERHGQMHQVRGSSRIERLNSTAIILDGRV